MQTIDFLIEHVLKTANPRVRYLLENRTQDCIGFGANQKTLKECGEHLKLSPDRIRWVCISIKNKLSRGFDLQLAKLEDDKIRVKLVEKLPETSEITKAFLIENLDLNVRARNTLFQNDIFTIEQLLEKNRSRLLRTPNFGHKSLDEIKAAITKAGYGKENFSESPFWKE
jgi:hypothetical protein